jgi:ATP phosphoribosyltransferase
MTDRLKIAIQKSGRLTDKSLELLSRCGLDFARSKDELFCFGRNMPVDLLLVRDDDIPGFLAEGICDVGLVGDNVAMEKQLAEPDTDSSRSFTRLRGLGYGSCRLSIALPAETAYRTPQDLNGMTLATSYPALLRAFLENNKVQARTVFLSGSVEIAPRLGTADGICDLVSSGATLAANRLREVETLLESEAALYQRDLTGQAEKQQWLDRLVQRLDSVLKVNESKYVMLHAPVDQLDAITAILPAAESPTVLPLGGTEQRVAVHTLCRENVLWEHLEQLKAIGASAILVLPVEKMLA